MYQFLTGCTCNTEEPALQVTCSFSPLMVSTRRPSRKAAEARELRMCSDNQKYSIRDSDSRDGEKTESLRTSE